jgi:hypothetical protein
MWRCSNARMVGALQVEVNERLSNHLAMVAKVYLVAGAAVATVAAAQRGESVQ